MQVSHSQHKIIILKKRVAATPRLAPESLQQSSTAGKTICHGAWRARVDTSDPLSTSHIGICGTTHSCSCSATEEDGIYPQISMFLSESQRASVSKIIVFICPWQRPALLSAKVKLHLQLQTLGPEYDWSSAQPKGGCGFHPHTRQGSPRLPLRPTC